MFKVIAVITALLCLIVVACKLEGQTISVNLTWTATGDDGMVGTATAYDLRYDLDSTALANDFSGGTPVMGLPDPKPSGSAESFTVVGLLPNTTYFFAIKAVDEAGNWSEISNIVRKITPDLTSPAAITDLQ